MLFISLNDNDTSLLTKLVPGKLFRDMRLSTNSALSCIDFASKMNMQYILFDAGWYGLGYKNEFNPLSNPFIVVDSIQIPIVLNYAMSKNIYLILYLKQRRYEEIITWILLFSLYSSWGVKVLKFGFVDGYSQSGRKFTKK
jgi:alpha-glucosidase